MVCLILALLCACGVHEGGHYAVARLFGKRLKFSFAWGELWVLPIPRFTWGMPLFFANEGWKRKAVALAGFGAEFLAAPIFWALPGVFGVWYTAVSALHLLLYRFYAGEDSDFKWVI
jgi:hypothetical protein